MTVIENYSPKIQYTGPVAIDDLLPISFPYNDTEDVKCLLNQTELVFNEDYTVTGQGLIFKITATEEDTITIYRSTPLDQQAEFPQNNRFNSAKLNASLDKICMQQQEQNEKITRSVKVPIDTNVSFEGSLPAPIPNRILRINEEASGFEFVPYDLDERLDTFEDTVIDNITAGQEDIESSFEEFKTETNININNIDNKVTNAVSTANTANTKSDAAVNIANTASVAATNAVNTSNSAVASANTAVATANSANVKSDEALLTSQEAKEVSVIAEENATTAKEKVDVFEQDIETVLEAADQIAQLESAIDAAIQAAEDATQAAEDAIQAAENAEASLSEKADKTVLNTHISNTSNPHSVTKSQVGLGNVDNTSDINKPISTATQTALNNKLDITGTAVKATADASGNNIVNTYATKIALDLKVDIDDMVAVNLPSPRALGEYVWSSIPLTDAALHLPDGTILDGNGINKDFVNEIADRYSKYPSLFVSEADWQASVSQYGVCGKYVYNQANNTVRLPKVTGFVEGTLDANALGDLVGAGLPNITGYFNALGGTPIGGAFFNGNTGNTAGEGDSGPTGVNLDASLSNPIYGNSDTVQPQSIKGYLYIVVATTTKTDIEVDIDNVVTDLNNKVDVSNMVNAGSYISGMGMPSNHYVDLALGASGTTYTAPANGWFYCYGVATSSSGYGTLDSALMSQGVDIARSGGSFKLYMPVRKGDVVTLRYGECTLNLVRFIYAEGEV